MRKLVQFLPIALILAGAAILFERPAYAYADPGTGLLAIQAAGSVLVATGWYLRRRVYALLHRGTQANPQPQECSCIKQDEGTTPP